MPESVLVVNVVATAYLAIAALWDWRTARVPNWLTLPALGGVLGLNVVLTRWDFLPYWLGIFAIWHLGILGGGDAKLLMVLFGLFPSYAFLVTTLVVVGGIFAVLLLIRYLRSGGVKAWLRWMLYRFLTLQVVPPPGENLVRAERSTFAIAAAGIVYLWLGWFWRELL